MHVLSELHAVYRILHIHCNGSLLALESGVEGGMRAVVVKAGAVALLDIGGRSCTSRVLGPQLCADSLLLLVFSGSCFIGENGVSLFRLSAVLYICKQQMQGRWTCTHTGCNSMLEVAVYIF